MSDTRTSSLSSEIPSLGQKPGKHRGSQSPCWLGVLTLPLSCVFQDPLQREYSWFSTAKGLWQHTLLIPANTEKHGVLIRKGTPVILIFICPYIQSLEVLCLQLRSEGQTFPLKHLAFMERKLPFHETWKIFNYRKRAKFLMCPCKRTWTQKHAHLLEKLESQPSENQQVVKNIILI